MLRRMKRNDNTGIPCNHMTVSVCTNHTDHKRDAKYQVHSLRVGVARHFRSDGVNVTRQSEEWFDDTGKFWEFVSSHVLSKLPLWIWSYNAGKTMSVLRLFDNLGNGTLSLRRFSIGVSGGSGDHSDAKTENTLCVTEDPPTIIQSYFSSGRSIRILDLANWLLAPIREIAAEVGVELPERPGEIGDDNDWTDYCRAEARVVETAVATLLRFVKEQDLGNFKSTAASQSLAFFRHRCLSCPIGIETRTDVKEIERKAYYGGRREVYFQGCVVRPGIAGLERMAGVPDRMPVLHKGPVYALDLCGAYPSVMRGNLYPTAYIRSVREMEPHALRDNMRALCAVAHVRVDTGCDPWPDTFGDEIVWKRGQFDTFLCGPELIRALDGRYVKRVYLAQFYTADRPFDAFVDAVWRMRKGCEYRGENMMARLCKLLANSLHGKFAQRVPRWESVPNVIAPFPWGPYVKINAETGEMEKFRSIAWHVQKGSEGGESEKSFPLLSAYVTAYCRERMRGFREQAGYRNTLYEDADSIHVTADGLASLKRAGCVAEGELGKLKIVCSGDTAIYLAHKLYQLGEKRVYSGIATDAVKDSEGFWHQTNWLRLNSLLGEKGVPQATSWDVRAKLKTPPVRGRVDCDGWVEPLHAQCRK